MKQVIAQVGLAAAIAAGCSPAVRPSLAPRLDPQFTSTSSCRASSDGYDESSRVRWIAPRDAEEKVRLDSWCAAVGPALVRDATAANDARLEDIAFVSWNVHVGAGEIERFVGDVRSGRLSDGRRPRQLVLMLQEAVRSSGVPAVIPDGASAAGRIGSDTEPAAEIGRVADALNMSLFYAPSMRNGNASDAHEPSDRGNAILSTLPISAPMAIELPGDGQRRVAVTAAMQVIVGDRPATLSIGAAHLATRASARTLWVFGAAGLRQKQAASLAEALPDGPMTLGADLNTWIGGPSEPAARHLLRAFPSTPTRPREATAGAGLVLDYMFFRVPAGWRAKVVRAPERYGSDHYPLIGWMERG